jgi:hypothetical protein
MAVDINGDGLIALGGTSTTQGRVRLAEDTDNGTNYVELTANAAVTTNRTVTFPDADINFTTGLSATLGGTGITSVGTAGNVLTSNGTAWLSQAVSAGGDYVMQVFTSPGTWTKPANLKAVKVTVIGGGGGSTVSPNIQTTSAGGGGGSAIKYIDAPTIPGPVSVTRGAGAVGTGGTSSFGPFCSATGGSGTVGPAIGNGGVGSSGDLNIQGGGGQPGPLGTGGITILGASPVGPNGTAGLYGGGGPGRLGSSADTTGANGVIIVEEFY